VIIDVVTLFPSMFSGVVGESILKRAQEQGQVKINLVNLRDFSKDKHKKVDAPPYGGGPGMVIMAEPVFDAVEPAEERPGGPPPVLLTGRRPATRRWPRSSRNRRASSCSAVTTKDSTSG
jgi:tRNA (guanine-N1)-methyltransferase